MKLINTIYMYWLKFLKIFGNIQMFLLLTLIYIIFIPTLWIFIRLFSDPLNIKSISSGWKKIKQTNFDINYFKLQG